MEKDVQNVGKACYSSIKTLQSLKMVKFSSALRINVIRHGQKLATDSTSLGKTILPIIILYGLDFSKPTIIDWVRFHRDLCVENIINQMHTKIGGQNKMFEIDERGFSNTNGFSEELKDHQKENVDFSSSLWINDQRKSDVTNRQSSSHLTLQLSAPSHDPSRKFCGSRRSRNPHSKCVKYVGVLKRSLRKHGLPSFPQRI
ncbi:hypothetical protein RF11_05127 [Thelohanellus kitauei]|uniref:Uncharacterized protein n=1 Tax=Thelohanellus kitauei TaxID=669202 RepID=A0A0C2J675_THEKT|nr:hypothetical protein RF11_05127 [Thelohanellus kitauei]